MNIKDYILSGILEDYVMGLASEQERREVECLTKIYPELKEELGKLEADLELLALADAKPLPAAAKTRLFDAIEQEKTTAPVIAITTATDNPAIAPVKPITTNYFKPVAAAAVVLLIISTYFAVTNYKARNNAQANNTQLEQQLAATKKQMELFSAPGTTIVQLTGNEKAKQQSITVLWNKVSGTVYLNKVNFPKLQSGKQYQLWALKDGKPVDLGVFDPGTALLQMKNIDNCQAFAVTIEEAGGSPTPHLDQLCGIQNI